MSHNVNYADYEESVSRKKVQAECDDVAIHEDYQEGCSGVSSIRWLDYVSPLSSRDEAESYINSHDKGWYDCLAVRYYVPTKASASLKKAQDKVTELNTKRYALANKFAFADVKSEFLGCKNCGSKISRKYLKCNYCPVCRADMRCETTLNAIKKAEEAVKKAEETVKEELKKSVVKNRKIMWLVKYEYHT